LFFCFHDIEPVYHSTKIGNKNIKIVTHAKSIVGTRVEPLTAVKRAEIMAQVLHNDRYFLTP
jgi:hypothetical protein